MFFSKLIIIVGAFIILSLYSSLHCEAAVLSIDYGTEWFKVALVKPGVPMEIVLNRDSKRKTQSTLNIRENERVYGSDSVNLAARFPRNTFFSLKRILGRSFDDKYANEYRSIYPNEMLRDPSRNSVTFKINDNVFSVEELVAMQFAHAKEQAEATAQESLRDAVITVPPFFTQSERRAILDAADLAGLNVISLIHDETAVAINYAISHFSSFTNEPQYHIFFDMGAGSTVASLISFNTANIKDVGRFNKTIIQLEVKSVGFDRTLGGQAFDLRLQKHLANGFDRLYKGKIKSSIFTSERAMVKLLKEANRVKQILSANTETIASIENLHEEFDFRLPVTRRELETLSDDLLKRVSGPIDDALSKTIISKEDIKSLVLVGGGVRIPAVQAVLSSILGEDKIAKNVNGDEAAALGAVFRGAGLSGQFKVKEIKVKDLIIYPIEVEYTMDPKETEDGTIKSKSFRTNLFNSLSPIGTRKIMTFKRTTDFEFGLNYGQFVQEMDTDFGPKEIVIAQVNGLSEAIEKFKDVSVERPKVKVTIQLSDSGIVSATDAIATIATEQTSLADKVKSFFGVNTNTTEESIKDAPIPEETKQSENSSTPSPSTDNDTASNETEPATKETKTETIKLKLDVQYLGIPPMSENVKRDAFDRLRMMDRFDHEKRTLEEARNNLESFVYRAQDFLNDDSTIKVTTSDERKFFSSQLSEVSDWIYEGGEHASINEFRGRLDHLKSLEKPLAFRREEHHRRPAAVSYLRDTIKIAQEFVKNIRTNTSIENQYHSDQELESLSNLCNQIETWLNEAIDKQEKISLYADPVFRVMDVNNKAQEIYNEFLRLLNKKPPKKPKAVTTASSETATIIPSQSEKDSSSSNVSVSEATTLKDTSSTTFITQPTQHTSETSGIDQETIKREEL
ncbi:2173_t:CDS:10 [Ambispora gerdemannii]|uniref:2173_t:CDS:1 n=1 Tax=Ambispora gerdemannii TaxID=144530 RepID=A0A9N8WTD1_9GLOM|nr:2173_t:CDS:10 [Ambispora gerdemannii]